MPMGCAPGNMRCLVAAVMLACAVAVSPARAQPAPASPVSSIRVTGDAKVTARPDRVQIDIGVSTRAAQSQEAAEQNARQVDAVLAAVRKATGAAVLKTISYTLNPTYQYHPKGEEPTITGYSALNVVQVTLDDLARIGTVIDTATQAGANYVQGIQFTLRDQDAVRAQALREAAMRARAQADVLAAALGLKVVRDIMSSPVLTVSPDTSVQQCMQLVTDKRVRHLPVVEAGRVVGVVSIGDLVKAVIAEQQQQIEQLESYIHS